MTSTPVGPNKRKIVLQLAAGGLFGFVSAMAVGWALPELDTPPSPGAAALIAIGLIYTIMGLFVGLGVVLPGLGARLLNVVDREDLADQRAILAGSAVSCIALGLALMLLALAGPQSEVSNVLAIGALAFAMILTTAITMLQWQRYDELMRGISLEASTFMAGIAFPVIVLWAAFAQTGLAGPIDPLGLVALLAGSMLIASFIAAGRRGLLLPR
jgi:hypothetical protein